VPIGTYKGLTGAIFMAKGKEGREREGGRETEREKRQGRKGDRRGEKRREERSRASSVLDEGSLVVPSWPFGEFVQALKEVFILVHRGTVVIPGGGKGLWFTVIGFALGVFFVNVGVWSGTGSQCRTACVPEGEMLAWPSEQSADTPQDAPGRVSHLA